jgi:mevalonate kinase
VGGIGRASGKLLLFGEHAAVYGHPAVGLSLPEVTRARLVDTEATEWDVAAIPEEDRQGVRGILSRLEEAVPGLAARGRCTVLVESRVIRKAGFGSSAALCGALARAVLDHLGEPERAGGDVTRAWRLAHDTERLFHGTPSGVDTGLSLLGGTCVLRPHPPGLPAYSKVRGRGLCLIVGAVPRDAACAALIARLGAQVKSGDTAARASVDKLGRLAAEAAELLLSDAEHVSEPLGELAERAMDQLRALRLSTTELDTLLQAARAAGSLGGKLSGAGGGGAFFAIASDREAAALIASRLQAAAVEAGITLTSGPRVLTLPEQPLEPPAR